MDSPVVCRSCGSCRSCGFGGHRWARGRRQGRDQRRGLWPLALALLACSPASPTTPPAAAVQRFYAAAAAGDCATALSTLGGGLRTRVAPEGTCDHLFEELRQHPLEHVVATQVDGRNRAAQLVRTRLRGRTTDVIIRVQAEGSQWKIFSL